MFGRIATAAAYMVAPKKTFAVKHPIRATQMVLIRRGLRSTFTPQRLALGLGAAALAVPVGLWVGQRLGRG